MSTSNIASLSPPVHFNALEQKPSLPLEEKTNDIAQKKIRLDFCAVCHEAKKSTYSTLPDIGKQCASCYKKAWTTSNKEHVRAYDIAYNEKRKLKLKEKTALLREFASGGNPIPSLEKWAALDEGLLSSIRIEFGSSEDFGEEV